MFKIYTIQQNYTNFSDCGEIPNKTKKLHYKSYLQEQELARKLSDLRENFAKNNKESVR